MQDWTRRDHHLHHHHHQDLPDRCNSLRQGKFVIERVFNEVQHWRRQSETLMPSYVGSFCGCECVFTSLQHSHTHLLHSGQFFSSAHRSFKQCSINQRLMLNLESLMNANTELLKLMQYIHELYILYHVFDYVQLNQSFLVVHLNSFNNEFSLISQ